MHLAGGDQYSSFIYFPSFMLHLFFVSLCYLSQREVQGRENELGYTISVKEGFKENFQGYKIWPVAAWLSGVTIARARRGRKGVNNQHT